MSHHQFFGWDSFKHCLLFRRSKNIFWSSLQVWSEGHCHNLAKVISPIIWFQQLGRKASVTFGSSDDQRTYSGHATNFRFWTTIIIVSGSDKPLSLFVGQNMFWSCHQLSILDHRQNLVWFRQLGRKASVTVRWSDRRWLRQPGTSPSCEKRNPTNSDVCHICLDFS